MIIAQKYFPDFLFGGGGHVGLPLCPRFYACVYAYGSMGMTTI